MFEHIFNILGEEKRSIDSISQFIQNIPVTIIGRKWY